MSRSIKQYKEAMDSLKVSDSFAKRTESLLCEADEKENMSPVRGNVGGRMKITVTACAGLAACIAAVMILKPNISEPSSVITSGDAGITAVTSSVITEAPETETEQPAAEIIVALENDGQKYVRDNDPALGMLDGGENGAAAAGNSGSDADNGSGSEKSLYNLDYGNISASLISYVNGDKNPTAILTGENAWNLVSPVAYVVYGMEELEENAPFVSEFVLILNDSKTGETYYTIYVNKAGTIVLNDHTGETQVRKTYLPEEQSFNDIEKAMFLCFVNEEKEYYRFAEEKQEAATDE